jgi:MSHA biogenesis protein MshL
MQNTTTEEVAQLPVFGNIPFLGTLLRNTKQQAQKTELVILLRATVVNNKTNNREIAEATQRMAGAKRGFHVGGRPDIYGTEGEVPIAFGPAAGNYSPHN